MEGVSLAAAILIVHSLFDASHWPLLAPPMDVASFIYLILLIKNKLFYRNYRDRGERERAMECFLLKDGEGEGSI